MKSKISISTAHLPLHVVGERLVRLPDERPVGAAERERHGGDGEGAVARDVVVHGLCAARVDHADVVIDQQLGHDRLLRLGRAAGQRQVLEAHSYGNRKII